MSKTDDTILNINGFKREQMGEIGLTDWLWHLWILFQYRGYMTQ